MLAKLARFRWASADHCVIISVSHEFDSTKQMMAHRLLQRLGRPSTRRVQVDVMYQSCKIFVCLSTAADTCFIAEQWICRPLAVLGKTAPFIVKCIELCKPFKLDEERVVTAMALAADMVIEDLRCDKGASNYPCLRHFGAVLEEAALTAMFDTSNCEVHVLNKVKNHVRQIKVMVGKLYSMANILKQGSVLEEMVDNIQAIVEQEAHRVECGPPTGSQ